MIITEKNIDKKIKDYMRSLLEIEAAIKHKSTIEMFLAIKRNEIGYGPYPRVSLIEAANRSMSDLVNLYAIKYLLNRKSVAKVNLPFDRYNLIFGNDHGIDIYSEKGDNVLLGEGFNVARSYFPIKRRQEVKSLNKEHVKNFSDKNVFKLIAFNSEAVEYPNNYLLKSNQELMYLPITLYEANSPNNG